MNELQSAAAALASLVALTCWARAVPTRAWGDGTAGLATPQPRAWAVVLGTLLLQTATAILSLGWAAGIALVLAAWMVLGWLLVLAMNQWPRGSMRWAKGLGWTGAGICTAMWIVHLVRAILIH